jgi:hypothetical protein
MMSPPKNQTGSFPPAPPNRVARSYYFPSRCPCAARGQSEGFAAVVVVPLGIQSWIKDGSRLALHQAVRID